MQQPQALSAVLMCAYFFVFLCGFGPLRQSCTPGQTQQCICPEGKRSQQLCRDDAMGWEPCECTYYTVWCDETSGLCWQDPQMDALKTDDDIGVTPADGIRYCRRLAIGGYTDWRLPTIDELRTLIRGNPLTETGGECSLTNNADSDAGSDPACYDETWPIFAGPGTGTAEGCYWPPELGGSCDRPDPESDGHPMEYASSTRCPGAPFEGWYGVAMFEIGAVAWNHIETLAEVRCVRDGPTDVKTCMRRGRCMPGETRRCITRNLRLGAQVCSAAGNCWGACESSLFIPTPPPRDVCPTCDQIHLTIRVPETLDYQPAQLMAFLYSADTWSWPPNRPPDGGNSDCQIANPAIDVDMPYELNVPACTYYRRHCLSGDYMLYVALMQTETMPPRMQAGDYWWGMDQEPLLLGSGDRFKLDIELVPWTDQ